MTEEEDREIIKSSGSFFNNLANQVKLIMRLMVDPRVNPILKLLPIGSVLYFIFPDIAPGPIDDIAIIWLGSYLFVELCPPDIVQEHLDAIEQVVPGEWQDIDAGKGDIIDVDYWEEDNGDISS